MEAKLDNAVWHATVPWANQLTADQRTSLVKEIGLHEDDLPAKAWMTTFEDRTSPRPGSDEVYFDAAKDRSPIRPPPFVNYHEIWIPIDVVVFVLLLLVYKAVKYVRRERTKPA